MMSKKKSLSAPAAAWWFVASALLLTAAPETPKIRIGGNVQATRIVSQVKPVYPPEAKAARIQGTVQLLVEIAADGKVKNVSVISGPPELVKSAVDAVSQWAYQPTLLNKEPVEVITTVDVKYTLDD
jgi:periplasmic protein TonB